MYSPNFEIHKSFPHLEQPLWSQIEDQKLASHLSIYLPKNYNSQDQFPLLVWLGGATGGAGDNVHWARSITQDRDFISVNLPLYKLNLKPLAPDRSNYWSRMIVKQEDSSIIWQQYQVLLGELFRLVPNIDRSKTFLGGFSNGAHTTAVLLNDAAIDVFHYFNHFIFVEGGGALASFSQLRGLPLVIFEGSRRKSRPFGARMATMEDGYAHVEYVVMRRTGHDFPKRYQAVLRQWMLGQLEG